MPVARGGVFRMTATSVHLPLTARSAIAVPQIAGLPGCNGFSNSGRLRRDSAKWGAKWGAMLGRHVATQSTAERL